jgi:hypothetical protein
LLLADLSGAVHALSHRMLTQRMPLHEALAGCGFVPFDRVAENMAQGASPGDGWQMACVQLKPRGQMLDCMDEQDGAALNRLFSALGSGGAQAQRVLLDEAGESLARLAEGARKKRDEQGRLYATLGALAGMALAVMLI